MKRTPKVVAVTVATLAIAAVSAVYAFPGPDMGPGMGPGMMSGIRPGMGPGMGMMGGMHGSPGPGAHGAIGDMSASVAGRMADLKGELKITAAQEPAWQAFTSKVAEQAQAMQAQRRSLQAGDVPAPDRMAQRTAFMKQRLAGMESMNAALKDLYGVLTPEQKAAADKRLGYAGHAHMAMGPRATQ
ncbi:MAG: Spy/CpxP family protein refolding chaperone [Burkholderiales bacterium]|nr:Spy/CpxP family protein refolding chaperone [Burkholderiales bacterium]